MNNENRKEWAVLLGDHKSFAKGENIIIQIVRPCGGHGGGYLQTEVKSVKVSEIKEIAPNMLFVQTKDADYYMYNYNLSDRILSHLDGKDGWTIEDKPKIGEKCLFTRRDEKNGYREESTVSPNPIYELQVIHSNLAIAWCEDEMAGNIGYVIRTESFENNQKGNYYWVWGLEAQKANKETSGYITVDLAGDRVTAYVKFVPRKATAIDNWTILEAEDGNFYIWQVPMEIGWEP